MDFDAACFTLFQAVPPDAYDSHANPRVCARDTPYKKSDERGLYLEVFPNGSKLWRLKHYTAGKEKRLALGAWPEVSLQKARCLRDELRLRIADGEDPSLTRKRAKATAKISAANTFDSVASEYIEQKMVGEGSGAASCWQAIVPS